MLAVQWKCALCHFPRVYSDVLTADPLKFTERATNSGKLAKHTSLGHFADQHEER